MCLAWNATKREGECWQYKLKAGAAGKDCLSGLAIRCVYLTLGHLHCACVAVCVCACECVKDVPNCQRQRQGDARRTTLDAVTPRPDGPKHSYSLGAPLKLGAHTHTHTHTLKARKNCSANVSTITHWKGQRDRQGRQSRAATGRQAGRRGREVYSPYSQ